MDFHVYFVTLSFRWAMPIALRFRPSRAYKSYHHCLPWRCHGLGYLTRHGGYWYAKKYIISWLAVIVNQLPQRSLLFFYEFLNLGIIYFDEIDSFTEATYIYFRLFYIIVFLAKNNLSC